MSTAEVPRLRMGALWHGEAPSSQLLNGQHEPFEESSSKSSERNDGTYKLTRDLATYAITKEVEAGRGTPAGGAYLSFRHIPEPELRRAFGPVIDRLAANGIDLARQDIEVALIAHYHMGGVRVSPSMETNVSGLFACGEAIGGSNGANHLSGNAISEAFVFGAHAGQSAACADITTMSLMIQVAQWAIFPLLSRRAALSWSLALRETAGNDTLADESTCSR